MSNLWRLGLSAHVGMAAPRATSVTKPKSSTAFPQPTYRWGFRGRILHRIKKDLVPLSIVVRRRDHTLGG